MYTKYTCTHKNRYLLYTCYIVHIHVHVHVHLCTCTHVYTTCTCTYVHVPIQVMREVGWVVFDEIHYMRDKGI